MLLRLSCSVCCARAVEGLVRGASTSFAHCRLCEREARRREQQVGRRRERERRRPGAACGLDSCAAPLLPLSPRSPRSHIIYDSIRTRSKLAVLSTNNKLVFPLTRLAFFAKYNSYQDAGSIKPTAKKAETITQSYRAYNQNVYEKSHLEL